MLFGEPSFGSSDRNRYKQARQASSATAPINRRSLDTLDSNPGPKAFFDLKIACALSENPFELHFCPQDEQRKLRSQHGQLLTLSHLLAAVEPAQPFDLGRAVAELPDSHLLS